MTLNLETPLPQGTLIRFANGTTYKGTGKVCGISTSGQAVIGRGLIVELFELTDGEGKAIKHPYTHISIFEIEVKEVLE